MNRIAQIIVGVVLMLVVAGGSFYGGMVYGQGQGGSTADQASAFAAAATARANGTPVDPAQFGGRGQAGQAGQAGGGNTFGQIDAIADGVMTLTTNAGATITVQVAETTLIEKNATVTLDDLTVGETVLVSGSQNDDGSITARSVQVSPAGRFGTAPTQ